MTEFTMPSLGADMVQGTLLEWLVKPGDEVHRGDIVAVVDTAKAAVEVEVFTDGVVTDLLVEVGTTVPVGAPLARISEPAPASPAVTARTPAPTPAPTPVPTPALGPAPTSPTGAARAHPHEHAVAPLARRMAADLGIDPDELAGTGLHGRVTRDDVARAAAGARAPEAAVAAAVASPGAGRPVGSTAAAQVPAARPAGGPAATPYARRLADELGLDLAGVATLIGNGELPASRADGVLAADDVHRAAARASVPAPTIPAPPAAQTRVTSEPPTRPDRSLQMRAAIAALMARSKREIPHYYLTQTVDLSVALSWMTRRNLDLPVARRLVPAALMLRAVALAARRHPELNGFWVDGAFVPGPGVHLGVAVSLRGGGLVAPALHDADTLGVEELMVRMRDLVTRARAGRLRGSEMSDPTLTVTNLGERGAESVTGVIYPPQVALVGVGRVVERPWAVDGMLTIRPVTTLTLAADHRATDGFSGSRLLATIQTLLDTPEEL